MGIRDERPAPEGLVLVLPARRDPERNAVATAWAARGGRVVHLERFWEPPVFPQGSVRLYGDVNFCQIVAQKLGLELVSPPDDLSVGLSREWLLREVACIPLQAALERRYPLFVKPLAAKLFRASVYETAAMLATETHGLGPETPVLVSDPVRFTGEARCLVLDRHVLAVAAYEGDIDSSGAAHFAEAFAADVPLPSTVALDVGFIEGLGWALVETNAVWGAGLNGCAPDAMVDCLIAATTTAMKQ